jgi:hypothetical protein
MKGERRERLTFAISSECPYDREYAMRLLLSLLYASSRGTGDLQAQLVD